MVDTLPNNVLQLIAISDLPTPQQGQLKLQLMDFNGQTIWTDTTAISLDAHQIKSLCTKDCTQTWSQYPRDQVVLQATLTTATQNSTTLYYFESPKNLALQKTTLQKKLIPRATDYVPRW